MDCTRARGRLGRTDVISVADLARSLGAVARHIRLDADRLNALDSAVGDGDHGVTMTLVWEQVAAVARTFPGADVGALFALAGREVVGRAGGASGLLWGTALRRAGLALRGRTELDGPGLAECLQAARTEVMERGRAQVGGKTMLDALAPAAEAASAASAAGADLCEVLDRAIDAAEAGALATVEMLAAAGRASRLGERARGHMDPGAASFVEVLRAVRASAVDIKGGRPM